MSKPSDKPFFDTFMSFDPVQQVEVYSKMVDDLESPVQEHMQNFVADNTRCRIAHAIVGVTSEAGETMDQFKKALVYGKELDLVNLDEEMGDKIWYLQLYCNARGITIFDLMAMNYQKLRTRYGDKFSQEACFNRDLTVERQNLEASQSAFRVQDDINKLPFNGDRREGVSSLDAVGIESDSKVGKTSSEQH